MVSVRFLPPERVDFFSFFFFPPLFSFCFMVSVLFLLCPEASCYSCPRLPPPIHPTPYTLHHPAPYTLHPTSTPYTLPPTPYTLPPTPYTLHPTPYTLLPPCYTLHPHPAPSTLHPTLCTLHTTTQLQLQI